MITSYLGCALYFFNLLTYSRVGHLRNLHGPWMVPVTGLFLPAFGNDSEKQSTIHAVRPRALVRAPRVAVPAEKWMTAMLETVVEKRERERVEKYVGLGSVAWDVPV
jgi:hypothetical protein